MWRHNRPTSLFFSNKFEIFLTQGCATGLESWRRPILLKTTPSFPRKKFTHPAAKKDGQLQLTLKHDRRWSTVLPELSLLIRNLMTWSEKHEVTYFGEETTKPGNPWAAVQDGLLSLAGLAPRHSLKTLGYRCMVHMLFRYTGLFLDVSENCKLDNS